MAQGLEKINAQARELVEDEKVEKFFSGAAPTVAKHATTALTGSDTAGAAVGAVVGGLSRSHGKAVAEVTANVALGLGYQVLAVVAIPFLVGYGLYRVGARVVTGEWPDDKDSSQTK